MTEAGARLRRPTSLPLTDLERDANLAALGHVFPRDVHPFPEDDVSRALAVTVLADDVVVEVD